MSDTPPGAPPLPALGRPWSIRTAAAEGADLELVHTWMNAPHIARRWHQDWPLDKWAADLTAQRDGDRSRPCLVDRDGGAFAYVELYWAARDALARFLPDLHPHDIGFHIAVGAGADTGRGLGRALTRALVDAILLAHPSTRRVVCEPDRENAPMLAMLRAAGFTQHSEAPFPHKVAAVMAFDRDQGR